MGKFLNLTKVIGFLALLALTLISAVPAASHAGALEASSISQIPNPDKCNNSPETCFVIVNSDGSISTYLGRLLN